MREGFGNLDDLLLPDPQIPPDELIGINILLQPLHQRAGHLTLRGLSISTPNRVFSRAMKIFSATVRFGNRFNS